MYVTNRDECDIMKRNYASKDEYDTAKMEAKKRDEIQDVFKRLLMNLVCEKSRTATNFLRIRLARFFWYMITIVKSGTAMLIQTIP